MQVQFQCTSNFKHNEAKLLSLHFTGLTKHISLTVGVSVACLVGAAVIAIGWTTYKQGKCSDGN